MTKNEAIEMLVNTKGTPCLSRNFIFWLYRNDYVITSPIERFDKKRRYFETLLKGINPFERSKA